MHVEPLHGADRHGGPAEQDEAALSAWRDRVVRVLDEVFDLGELRGRMTVVQYRDQTVALCMPAEYVQSDCADELERLVRDRGLTLAEPARVALPATVLVELSGGARATGRAAAASHGTPTALGAAFDEIVEWAVDNGASDVHFNVNLRAPHCEVRCSVEGRYTAPARFQSLPGAMALDMIAVAWMRVRGGNGAIFDPHLEQQGRIDTVVGRRPVMLRWASLATDAGPSVCLRILRLDETVAGRTLAGLGYLPSQITALTAARSQAGGAIVLAGAVGSGKSTTLATLLSGLGAHRKLVTLEDPVEYLIPGALQNTLSRTLDGNDHDVFDAKLRTIKRSAVDDLLIGEVRDTQTGRAFMDLSASGTRVYATTHTHAAVLIPERLASDFIGVSRDLLASPGILKLLVYQTLLPRLCPSCATPWSPDGTPAHDDVQGSRDCLSDAARLLDHAQIARAGVRLRCAAGCEACRRPGLPALWGYDGRTVAAECIAPSEEPAVLDCIRKCEVSTFARYMQAREHSDVADPDMRGKTATLCALFKVAHGQVDPRDLRHHLPHIAGGPWHV